MHRFRMLNRFGSRGLVRGVVVEGHEMTLVTGAAYTWSPAVRRVRGACGSSDGTKALDGRRDLQVLVDALPHDDERRREIGDVWLGFEEKKFRGFIEQNDLDVVAHSTLRGLTDEPALQFIVGRKK